MTEKKLPWFRMYTDFLNDPKMIGLSFNDQRHYIFLLCLQSTGTLDRSFPTAEMLNLVVGNRLGLEGNELSDAKSRLIEAKLIDEFWKPISWCRHKPLSDRLPSHLWNPLRASVFERDDYTCVYCGSRGQRLECDHVVPVSKGGGNEPSNLATSCFRCNRSKHNKSVSEWSGA